MIHALYAHTTKVDISIQGSKKKLIARKRGRDVCKHGYTFKLKKYHLIIFCYGLNELI